MTGSVAAKHTRPTLIAWALVAGVLLGVSQPLVIGALKGEPIDATGLSGLLSFVCFVPLLVLMHDARPKRAYWTAFLAANVGWAIVLYWLVIAMVVFSPIPLPAAILLLFLLTSTVAFVVAAPFAITRVICRRFALPQWIVFACCFTAAWLLGNYGPNGGFPWGAPAMALTTLPLLLQGASLVGVYGLVFVVALVNGVIAEVFVAWRRREPLPKGAMATAAVVLVVLVGWGFYRLATERTDLPTVRVGMLQGNIEQGIKNKGAQHARVIEERYHRMQEEALAKGADIIVWPEAALPRSVNASASDLKGAGVIPRRDDALVPPAGVIGAVAWEKHAGSKRGFRHYNTAIATGDDLEVLGRWDKRHLVPFGEYVPWPLGAIVRKIVPGEGSTPGAPWHAIALPVEGKQIPVGTTICYEGIFPEISRAFVDDGAQLMFNVTNDAWYGVSSAATQHLSYYAMRAAETGRAVARAANTGITAWVDTRGRIHDETKLYEEAVLVADLPLNDEITPYVRLGEWVALPATLFALGMWIYALLGASCWRRDRHVIERAVGVVGLGLAAFATLSYFLSESRYGDEGAANLHSAGTAAALLVGAGALSGRSWGRTAQIWVGAVAALLCAVGVVFGSLLALPFALFGAVVAGLAWRRKHAYGRAADPELAPGTDK